MMYFELARSNLLIRLRRLRCAPCWFPSCRILCAHRVEGPAPNAHLGAGGGAARDDIAQEVAQELAPRTGCTSGRAVDCLLSGARPLARHWGCWASEGSVSGRKRDGPAARDSRDAVYRRRHSVCHPAKHQLSQCKQPCLVECIGPLAHQRRPVLRCRFALFLSLGLLRGVFVEGASVLPQSQPNTAIAAPA